jgi:hypothetical protein
MCLADLAHNPHHEGIQAFALRLHKEITIVHFRQHHEYKMVYSFQKKLSNYLSMIEEPVELFFKRVRLQKPYLFKIADA